MSSYYNNGEQHSSQGQRNTTLPPIAQVFPDMFPRRRPAASPPSSNMPTPTPPPSSRRPDRTFAVFDTGMAPLREAPTPTIPLRETRTHDSCRRYVCEECGQRCPTPSALETHTRTHTGARPYICRYRGCRKDFTTSSNLKRHEATHTAESAFEDHPRRRILEYQTINPATIRKGQLVEVCIEFKAILTKCAKWKTIVIPRAIVILRRDIDRAYLKWRLEDTTLRGPRTPFIAQRKREREYMLSEEISVGEDEQRQAKRKDIARNQSDLTQEINAYEALKGLEGFPTYHGHGTMGGNQYIILGHVGCDLDRLLKRHPELFVKEVVTFLLILMIRRLQTLHSLNFIHGDIKPKNFCVSATSSSKPMLYMIDMGTVRRYSYRGQHLLEDKTPCSKTCTVNFASINTHKGKPLSRRDDLELFTYTVMALSPHGLPWDGLTTAEPLLKFTTSSHQDIEEQLYKGQPPGMDRTVYAAWLYAKTLDYYQEPDYELLTAMFLPL
ncbi:hypothetical protein M422DRAFT_255243 [Sphaerobolus stellatus SS14]|uniref:non-specific serine/threonine protein kinase n=1 Tax=Sphaerobolus stellatus (strain SS14) TaxID=990650 RepID=A0A0C9VT05_SPHS4|nr:hypothetical protein M422DRAFT_255243 [Sphaerobolus stellatus SS14]